MFVWECINTEGHHLGMCVDTFMFGSCCSHNVTKNEISPLVQEKTSSPTLLYTKPSSLPTHKTSFTSHKSSTTTPLYAKPTTSTLIYSKPFRQTPRPQYFYSHKDISSSMKNMTQRPYVKPLKESLGRPINVYSNNEKIDDFSTEAVNRWVCNSVNAREDLGFGGTLWGNVDDTLKAGTYLGS